MNQPISNAQILGHAIAYEVGHLLLNLKAHSAHGIMRSDCGLPEMRDAAYGSGSRWKVLRADGGRRSRQQETLEVN
jgi:hypothetical protein